MLVLIFFVANKPVKRPLAVSPDRRPTNEDTIDLQPSGVNLEQIDYPEDEEFDQNIMVNDLLDGLNWYARFQVSLMKGRKKRDDINAVFIAKLN